MQYLQGLLGTTDLLPNMQMPLKLPVFLRATCHVGSVQPEGGTISDNVTHKHL